MKKIIIERYEGKANSVHYEGNGFTSVGIYQMNNGWGNRNEKAIYGVNWSAIGTVSPNDAEEYVKLIQTAIKEVKKMNK